MGYGGHADPAGQHAGRDHPAPGRAVEVRAAARLAAPAHRRPRQPRLDPLGGGAWSRRRWIAAGAAVAILAALIVAATGLTLGDASPNTIAKQGDAKEGLDALEDSGIGSGALLPARDPDEGDQPRPGGRRRRAGSTASTARWRRTLRSGARGGRRRGRWRSRPPTTHVGRHGRRSTASATPPTRRARRPGGRPAGAERRLHQRRLRQLPADDRADRASSRSSCWRGRSARCCCR